MERFGAFADFLISARHFVSTTTSVILQDAFDRDHLVPHPSAAVAEFVPRIFSRFTLASACSTATRSRLDSPLQRAPLPAQSATLGPFPRRDQRRHYRFQASKSAVGQYRDPFMRRQSLILSHCFVVPLGRHGPGTPPQLALVRDADVLESVPLLAPAVVVALPSGEGAAGQPLSLP